MRIEHAMLQDECDRWCREYDRKQRRARFRRRLPRLLAVAAILAALVACLVISGCGSRTKALPDPDPKQPLAAARQALKTITNWLTESKAPRHVMTAADDLRIHHNGVELTTDALVKVGKHREEKLKERIAELENTALQRTLLGGLLALCVGGVMGGVWMLLTGGVRFGWATIGAGVGGIVAVRFVEASGPVAKIIGYSVGGVVALLLVAGIWYRGRAMLKKLRRDTAVIEIGEQNRQLAAGGHEPLKSLKDIAQALPESTPDVKDLTRRIKQSMGYSVDEPQGAA